MTSDEVAELERKRIAEGGGPLPEDDQENKSNGKRKADSGPSGPGKRAKAGGPVRNIAVAPGSEEDDDESDD